MTHRHSAIAALLLSALILTAGGCSSANDDAEAAPPAASSTMTPRLADPAGGRVCDVVQVVETDPATVDPAVLMRAGKDGTTSANASIRIGSQLMYDYAELVAAAVKNGTNAEVAARRADMAKQVLALVTACTNAGYYP